MKQRVITGILFAAGIALFLIPGIWLPWMPIPLFVAVSLITTMELISALRKKGMQPTLLPAIIGSMAMLVPVLFFVFPETGLPDLFAGKLTGQLYAGFASMAFVLFSIMGTSSIILLIRRGPAALPDATATAAVMAYVAFPMSCPALLLFHAQSGWLWLVTGLATPWISDVFAYFTGYLVGRRKIVPAISPKKTLEGSLGGVAVSMLAVPLLFRLFGPMQGEPAATGGHLLFFGLSGLLLSVSAQLGDWLASGIKRWCGIKDFGRILPGHGGLLDRFDSAFFTLPMTVVLAILFQVVLP
jgi:phosphatidate cytidylyltransferase